MLSENEDVLCSVEALSISKCGRNVYITAMFFHFKRRLFE